MDSIIKNKKFNTDIMSKIQKIQKIPKMPKMQKMPKMPKMQNFDKNIEILLSDDVHFNKTVSGYSTCHSMIRNVDKTIKSDLEKIGFSDAIIKKAVELHRNSQIGTRRGRRRKQTVFYYVFAAYNALGIPIEPKGLAERCGLKGTEISKAMSRCSPDGFSAPNIVVWSPVEYIPECYNMILKKTDIRIQFPENTLCDIIKMGTEVTQTEPNLLDQKPQTMAAAIVLYYLTIHGIQLNRKDYANLFKSSDMTINKIFKEVASAYNNSQC